MQTICHINTTHQQSCGILFINVAGGDRFGDEKAFIADGFSQNQKRNVYTRIWGRIQWNSAKLSFKAPKPKAA